MSVSLSINNSFGKTENLMNEQIFHSKFLKRKILIYYKLIYNNKNNWLK